MIKHIVAIILLSIIVILAMPYLQPVLQSLLSAHHFISDALKQVFSGGTAGDLTRQLLALLCIPVIVGLVPAAVYWLAKRSWFPYFMDFVWITWLIETAALIAKYTAPAAT